MKCEITRNGQTIAGPMNFDVNRVRDIVARQGADYRLVPNALSSTLTIGTLVIYPVTYIMPTLTPYQQHGKPVRSLTASGVTYTYPVEDKPIEAVRNEALGRIPQIHDAYDKGQMEYQGVNITVDLEARVNAEGVLKRFESGLMSATQWNGKSIVTTDENGESVEGPKKVAINGVDEMRALYNAIFAHLEKGFIAKEMLLTEVEAADEATLKALDVNERWTEIVATL